MTPKTKKALVFDASTLITISMNGLIEELRELKKIFDGYFLITQDVKHEVIDKPMKIKRFELEAVRIQQLLEEGTLQMPSALGIKDSEIDVGTQEIKRIANSTFTSRGKNIKLVDSGETSALALSRILDKKGIKNLIALDERTMRMISEDPEQLKKHMNKKLKTKLHANTKNYDYFKGFKFIRSSELIYVAYKKDLIKLKKGPVLDALLYALKFKGCAISREEIEEIKTIG